MRKKQPQVKAQKIVTNAVGTFSKAIDEVVKANEILEVAVTSDQQEMERITKEIEDAYTRLDEIQAEKLNKQSTIIQNKELIGKLEKFTA